MNFNNSLFNNSVNSTHLWSSGLFNHLPTVDNAFLSDVAAFEGLIIGLSIPISLQVVSWIADRYEDHELSQFFINEFIYKFQLRSALLNITLAVFLRATNILNPIILTAIYIWFIINIYAFYRFIKLIEEYAVEIDKVMLKKLKRSVDEIFK